MSVKSADLLFIDLILCYCIWSISITFVCEDLSVLLYWKFVDEDIHFIWILRNKTRVCRWATDDLLLSVQHQGLGHLGLGPYHRVLTTEFWTQELLLRRPLLLHPAILVLYKEWRRSNFNISELCCLPWIYWLTLLQLSSHYCAGHSIPALLDAILTLLPLDTYVPSPVSRLFRTYDISIFKLGTLNPHPLYGHCLYLCSEWSNGWQD